jgi:hypothetical protein
MHIIIHAEQGKQEMLSIDMSIDMSTEDTVDERILQKYIPEWQ